MALTVNGFSAPLINKLNVLPITSVVPNKLFAAFLVNTIEDKSFKGVFWSPLLIGKLNIEKKSSSTQTISISISLPSCIANVPSCKYLVMRFTPGTSVAKEGAKGAG